MRSTIQRFFIILLTFILGIISRADSQTISYSDLPRFVPGEVLVRFHKSKNLYSSTQSQVEAIRSTISNTYKLLNYEDFEASVKLQFERDSDVEAIADLLRKDSRVEIAQPNYLYYSSNLPTNDPFIEEQWHHFALNMPEVWSIRQSNIIGTNAREPVVAVIDTGVVYKHPDLQARMIANCDDGCPQGAGFDFVDLNVDLILEPLENRLPGEDYEDFDNDPFDLFGHGTHVSGIIAAEANNGIGLSGICQSCRILPIRAGFGVLNIFGQERGVFTTLAIQLSVDYAAANNADVINLSLGGLNYSQLLHDSIREAVQGGTLVIASAGNRNSDEPHYPSAYEEVISVGSISAHNVKSDFSNFGDTVDFVSYGERILTTNVFNRPVIETGTVGPREGYLAVSGTSHSAPIVAGVAAEVIRLRSRRGGLTPEEIRQILRDGSSDVREPDFFPNARQLNPSQIFSSEIEQAGGRVAADNEAAQILFPANNSVAYEDTTLSIIGLVNSQHFEISIGAGAEPSSWQMLRRRPSSRDRLGVRDAPIFVETGMATILADLDITPLEQWEEVSQQNQLHTIRLREFSSLRSQEPISEELVRIFRLFGGVTWDNRTAPVFVRGDANSNGALNLADVQFILNRLFAPESTPLHCERALDTNDDGNLNITDAVYLLNYLFLGGPAPASPSPHIGFEPRESADNLRCNGFRW